MKAMKMGTAGILAIFVIFLALPASAQEAELADPGVTPDSPFYFLELFFENIGTAVTFDEVKRAERYERLAEERLAEAKNVVEKGRPGLADKAVERYQQFLELAVEKAEDARERGRDTKAIKERVLAATGRHQAVLERVLEQVPDEARPAIRRAYEASLSGQVEVLAAISADDPDAAFESVQEKMREHMDRVRERLAELDGQESEQIELRFEAMKKLQEAFARVSEAKREEFIERIEGAMSDRMEEMEELREELIERAPELAERLQEAKGESVKSHVEVLRRLAERDSEEAARRFEEAADKRLERAERRARSGDSDEARDDVAEFEEYAAFGEEISEKAQGLRTGDTTVEELVERATSRHLEILHRVRDQVPEDARGAIDRAVSDSERHKDEIDRRVREFEDLKQREPARAEELREKFEQRREEQRPELEHRAERQIPEFEIRNQERRENIDQRGDALRQEFEGRNEETRPEFEQRTEAQKQEFETRIEPQ